VLEAAALLSILAVTGSVPGQAKQPDNQPERSATQAESPPPVAPTQPTQPQQPTAAGAGLAAAPAGLGAGGGNPFGSSQAPTSTASSGGAAPGGSAGATGAEAVPRTPGYWQWLRERQRQQALAAERERARQRALAEAREVARQQALAEARRQARAAARERATAPTEPGDLTARLQAALREAETLRKQGQVAEAIRAQERAVMLAQFVYGPRHAEVSRLQKDLADLRRGPRDSPAAPTTPTTAPPGPRP
jgi:hypothetical protein